MGGSAAVADFLISSHFSAQARIRSLDARGSDGGGTETSTGGSGGKLVFGAGALFCGAGAGFDGFCVEGDLCAGFDAGFACEGDLAAFAFGARGFAPSCALQGGGAPIVAPAKKVAATKLSQHLER